MSLKSRWRSVELWLNWLICFRTPHVDGKSFDSSGKPFSVVLSTEAGVLFERKKTHGEGGPTEIRKDFLQQEVFSIFVRLQSARGKFFYWVVKVAKNVCGRIKSKICGANPPLWHRFVIASASGGCVGSWPTTRIQQQMVELNLAATNKSQSSYNFSSNRRIKPERFMHWNQEDWCEATIAVLFMIFPRHHSSAMLWRTKALWWLWKGGPKFHLSGSSEVGCISCQVLVRLSKWPLIPASVRPIASPRFLWPVFDVKIFQYWILFAHISGARLLPVWRKRKTIITGCWFPGKFWGDCFNMLAQAGLVIRCTIKDSGLCYDAGSAPCVTVMEKATQENSVVLDPCAE